MFVLTCLRVEHCVSGTAGLTIVMLAHVSTTSTPRLLPFTRGPSSLSATFFTAGWSIRSLTLWVAARLWLMTLAGTRFQPSVVFFPGNHTAYGFTSEATREIDWQLPALETVPSITGLGSQWQFLFCKELVNHLLQLSDVGHSQELKWELVHL